MKLFRVPGRAGAGILLALLLALLQSGCATYGERVAPVPLPAGQADAVEVAGAQVLGTAFVEPAAAREAFGFDIRGAGLLPVQLVIDNASGERLLIQPQQSFLVDADGSAWPLLAADRAAERVRQSVAAGESIRSGARTSLLTGLAGAVAGAAIGIVGGGGAGEGAGKGAAAGAAIGALGSGAQRYGEVGRDIQDDLRESSMQNRVVRPGELAHGYLFFPGQGEASSARSLRLALQVGETIVVREVPLRQASPR
mgnify:CR=1 FL=1